MWDCAVPSADPLPSTAFSCVKALLNTSPFPRIHCNKERRLPLKSAFTVIIISKNPNTFYVL